VGRSGRRPLVTKRPFLVRRGVAVQHLAFCSEPMRHSTVERIALPTTAPSQRGAVAAFSRQPGDQTRVVGRVLRVDGQQVR
jgi:hypothetical protein